MNKKRHSSQIEKLEAQYRQIYLLRLAFEKQFEAVDSLEMIPTHVRDKWWAILVDYKLKETLLTEKLLRLKQYLLTQEASSSSTIVVGTGY